jgi:large subunit ribosomal protein L11
MEKVISAMVEGGKASAGPPLGPALGPLGVNIGEVINMINEKTKDFKGMTVPVKVIVNTQTKEVRVEVGFPPTSALIKKELGIEKAPGNREGELPNLSFEQVVKIARMKKDNMLANTLKSAVKEVLGTCVSMGVLVDGKDSKEVQKLIDQGEYKVEE